MKTLIKHRNGANQPRKSARKARRPAPPRAFEPLESRQLFSVTGLSVVEQASTFGGAPTTVKNEPTIFATTLQSTWQELIDGKLKINGQTLSQDIASKIQQGEESQGLSAYGIVTSFNASPVYNGMLEHTSSGPVLEMTFDASGNQTTFTSTTNSIFGSYADPTFHVTYAIDITVDLSLPSNIDTGQVTATATARTVPTAASSSNIFVTDSDLYKVAAGFATTQNVSSIVPTSQLNTALGFAALAGYTRLDTSVGSGGTELVLTLEKPTLTINGSANDHINISSGSKNSVVITSSGLTETFSAGTLKTIVVNNDSTGTNSVNIPSLPAGVAVQVKENGVATDNVTVGGTGSLASVAGTVSVSNSSGKTNLTENDANDTATSKLTVTSSAIQFNGRDVVTYSSGSKGETALTVDAGRTATTTIDSSSAPVTVIGLGGTVTVGNGSLAGLGGTVDVSNLGTVDIDDSSDKAARKVDLNSTTGGLGLSSSTVAFQGLSTIELGLVKNVTIHDGASDGILGDNTFDALGSPFKDFFTIDGHLGDTLTGPAASQVQFNVPLLSPLKFP